MLFAQLAIAAFWAGSALAKGTYMPPLADGVMDDLAKRDSSSYETFAWHNESSVQQLDKRGPPNNLYGIQSRCTQSHCLSYTFDDGPYKNMRKIVDTADSAGIKVSFLLPSGWNAGQIC